MTAGKFIPRNSNSTHCGDQATFGRLSTRYDYISKGLTEDDDYPKEACQPWLHYNMRVGNVQVDETIVAQGDIRSGTLIQAPQFQGFLQGTASGNKTLSSFDIPHVTQKGKRIRHIVAEGPEPGIYVRGKLENANVIDLPDYWYGLVDPETITVTLTQIGYSQDLIVEGIEWGRRVKIKSGTGANIHCYYEIWAARWVNPMDHSEELHVVYEGETPDDYPGNKNSFLVGGWDYDRRNPQWDGNKSTKEDMNNA